VSGFLFSPREVGRDPRALTIHARPLGVSSVEGFCTSKIADGQSTERRDRVQAGPSGRLGLSPRRRVLTPIAVSVRLFGMRRRIDDVMPLQWRAGFPMMRLPPAVLPRRGSCGRSVAVDRSPC
jgi:hypothetical protein